MSRHCVNEPAGGAAGSLPGREPPPDTPNFQGPYHSGSRPRAERHIRGIPCAHATEHHIE
jgi:hypothetical protein